MKKILCAVLVITMAVSCGKKWLETVPTTALLTDSALATPEGLEGAIYPVYDYPRKHLRSMTNCLYFIAGTHLIKANGLLSPDLGMALYNSSLNPTHSASKDFWNDSYKALEQANAIIGRADGAGFTDAKRKNTLVAQARFFRAYILFYLQQRFDRIPIVNEEFKTAENNFQPADSATIYNQIKEDLLFAIDHLDSTNTKNGKITKGAAQHLLAKVYLLQQQWANAAQMALNVINSNQYSLLADRSKLWADNSQNNEEAIYVIQFANNALDGSDGEILAPMFTPLIDRIPGVKRTFAQGGRPWARYYPSDYLIGLFEPADKRLEADYKVNWIYDNEAALPKKILPVGATDSITINVGDTVKWSHVTTQNIQQYGPACKKYWEYGASRGINDAASRKSIIRYRLGETYLIAAEALWRDGKPDEALANINKVRERAGAHLFTALTEDTLLDEYARECAFEQEDWFTLKRMGKLVSMVKQFSPDKDVTEISQEKIRIPTPQTFLDATPGYHITN